MPTDVNTLEEEIQNTDTKLDDNIEETVEEEIEDDNDDNEDDSIDELTNAELDQLTDIDFTEYINSGKIPDYVTRFTKDLDKEKKSKQDSVDDKTKESTEEDTTKQKESSKKEEKPKEDKSIDYKSAYNTIMKPFKANGKEITPKSIEDIINLTQMGANYTKKMQAMAPYRKIVETLSKANISKEDDINFLIDVFKGDDNAIKKLLEKHSIDPLNLDMEDTSYIPKNNIIGDDELEFRMTIDDIQESAPKIQDIINNHWDVKSKTAVLGNPAVLRDLNTEIVLGRFDKIQGILEQEKVMGRYQGVPDIEAYADVLRKTLASETLQHKSNSKAGTIKTKSQVIQEQTKAQTSNNNSTSQKSKAAPTTSKVGSTKKQISIEDLFALSDEEFQQLNINSLV